MRRLFSKRSDHVVRSEIRNMSLECDRLQGVNLSQGVCDTPVPDVVLQAAQSALDEGWNTYTAHTGISILKEAIARKLQRFSGLLVDPDSQIVVSAGATGALYCACMALLNPGDEVILFEPFYGYHLSTLRSTGLIPSYVPLRPPGWTFDPADLERACSDRTRAIIVCTPNNPTGKVFSREELSLLRDFAVRRDLVVLTDEIYEHFLYDGREHVCPATIAGMSERTVVISGFSKTLSVTGWRVGYAVCKPEWAEVIGYFSDLIYVCAPSPLQAGIARGLDLLPADHFASLSRAYHPKRDSICKALSSVGLTPYVPEGAYYVLANMEALPGGTSKEKAMFLLEQSGVACVPGESFFHNGQGEELARFCFAKDTSDLEEACRRLDAFARKNLLATG